MKLLRTHYDNLKVARDAPDIVIRAAYKSLSQKFHPDKNPGDERAARTMSIINQSYEILSDPRRRAEHDAWIAREEEKLKPRASQIRGEPDTIKPNYQQKTNEPNYLLSILLFPLKLIIGIIRAVPQIAIFGLIFGIITLYNALKPDEPPRPGPKPYSTTPVAQAFKPTYTRPALAPNGSPWPGFANYINGYEILNNDGLSTVTVDNSKNDSDVFVKLVFLNGPQAYPVRQFYIPAFGRFTLEKVTAGNYDVRYRDLSSGGLSRSESFNLEEISTYNGTQFSNITMTLYKVVNGNMQTYGLSESEF